MLGPISPDTASVINAVSKVLISCVITFLKTWPSSEYKLLLLLQVKVLKPLLIKLLYILKIS